MSFKYSIKALGLLNCFNPVLVFCQSKIDIFLHMELFHVNIFYQCPADYVSNLIMHLLFQIFLCFLTFSIIFTKRELFINLKKSISKSFFASFFNLVFILIDGFKHAPWSDWITVCTFLISVHDSMLVSEFLYEQHILFYHTNCIQAYWSF